MMKWCADASHSVHPGMKGQKGVAMTLGKVAMCNSSIKQKMNARSSTGSELVAA